MARRNTVLFVGDLSSICTEAHIRELFEVNGFNVVELKMMGGKVASNSYDYGFVELATADEAEVALASLDGTFLCGRRLRVKWAAPNIKNKPSKGIINSIHVRFQALVPGLIVTEETLLGVFEPFGAISDVSVKSCALNPAKGLHDGYGFVHFPCTPEGVSVALKAVSTLGENPIVDNVHYSCEMSKNLLRLLQVQSQKRQEMSLAGMYMPYGGQPRGSPPSAYSQGYISNARTGMMFQQPGPMLGAASFQSPAGVYQHQSPQYPNAYSTNASGVQTFASTGRSNSYQQMQQHQLQQGYVRKPGGVGLIGQNTNYRDNSQYFGEPVQQEYDINQYDINQLLAHQLSGASGMPAPGPGQKMQFSQSGLKQKQYSISESGSYNTPLAAGAGNYPPWVAATTSTMKSFSEYEAVHPPRPPSLAAAVNNSLNSGLGTSPNAAGSGSSSPAITAASNSIPPLLSTSPSATSVPFNARAPINPSLPFFPPRGLGQSPSASSGISSGSSTSRTSHEDPLSSRISPRSDLVMANTPPITKSQSYGYEIEDYGTETDEAEGTMSAGNGGGQSIEELNELLSNQSIGNAAGMRMF